MDIDFGASLNASSRKGWPYNIIQAHTRSVEPSARGPGVALDQRSSSMSCHQRLRLLICRGCLLSICIPRSRMIVAEDVTEGRSHPLHDL
jgi:hypothetical protein